MDHADDNRWVGAGLKAWLSRYANSGSNYSQNPWQITSAVLVNKIFICCSALVLVAATIDLIRSSWLEVFADLVIIIFLQVPIWFNRWGKFKSARVATIFIVNASIVLNCVVIGNSALSTIPFFAAVTVASAIFDSKDSALSIFSILLSVALYFFLNQIPIEPLVNIGASLSLVSVILNVFTFTVIVAVVWYFAEANRRALMALQEMLERQKADQAKLFTSSKLASVGQMAAGIAHEINNPLAIISGRTTQLGRLLQPDLDERTLGRAKRYIHSIQETTERISKIIRTLLIFARQQQDWPTVSMTARQLVDDVSQLCKVALEQRRIGFSIVDHTDGARIIVNAVAAQQILLNLINNAVDAVTTPSPGLAGVFSGEAPWIKIDISFDGPFVSLVVSDSGVRIPPHVAERLMEPFFTTKEIGKGAGLGLSISKELAQKLQGALYYDETLDNTSFILQLPRSIDG